MSRHGRPLKPKKMKEEHKISEDYREDASDVISRQCKELDAWRAKYRALVEKYMALESMYDNVVIESALMNDELISHRKKLTEKADVCEILATLLRKVDKSIVYSKVIVKKIGRLQKKGHI